MNGIYPKFTINPFNRFEYLQIFSLWSLSDYCPLSGATWRCLRYNPHHSMNRYSASTDCATHSYIGGSLSSAAHRNLAMPLLFLNYSSDFIWQFLSMQNVTGLFIKFTTHSLSDFNCCKTAYSKIFLIVFVPARQNKWRPLGCYESLPIEGVISCFVQAVLDNAAMRCWIMLRCGIAKPV